MIESDNGVLRAEVRQRLREDPGAANGTDGINGKSNGNGEVGMNGGGAVNGTSEVLPPEEFGYPRGTNHWASCVQIIDPLTDKAAVYTLELEENEAATAIVAAPFESQDMETFLVVATGKDMIAAPRSATCGYIHIYRFQDEGRSLEFIHKTKVEQPPLAMRAFRGRLLVGVGADLRIYDLGMKQLLRKAQAVNVVPRLMVGLKTQGARIVCSDVEQSVTYVVYKQLENRLIPFVDDTIPRWTTSTAMMDYETTAGADKFGNIWLVRCPSKISEEADEEGSAAHLIHEKGYLQGTPSRLDLMIHFYCQDIPTSMTKTSLVAGGRDVLFWSGLQGTLGILVPFVSREDVDFFQNLEGHMRTEDPPLTGRDHLAYRSYYAPVKSVIDGDLCERFSLLKRDLKERIAAELDRSVREVERKISDMRTRVAY